MLRAAESILGDLRLGIADHLGWAIAVAASADHEVVDRRRIELAGAYEPVVSQGDAGRAASRAAAEGLWALRAELDAAPPVEPDALLADLAERLSALFAAETEAIAALKNSGVPSTGPEASA